MISTEITTSTGVRTSMHISPPSVYACLALNVIGSAVSPVQTGRSAPALHACICAVTAVRDPATAMLIQLRNKETRRLVIGEGPADVGRFSQIIRYNTTPKREDLVFLQYTHDSYMASRKEGLGSRPGARNQCRSTRAAASRDIHRRLTAYLLRISRTGVSDANIWGVSSGSKGSGTDC